MFSREKSVSKCHESVTGTLESTNDQMSSLHKREFEINLVQVLFTSEELAGCNCSGKKGKMPLHNVKLQRVKKCVLKLYSSQASQTVTEGHKTCVIPIDGCNYTCTFGAAKGVQKSDCAVDHQV